MMIKTMLSALVIAGTAGAASAQTVYSQQPRYDYAPTGTVQSYDSPAFTGTMPYKWIGPGRTTGRSYGPDGTPGNGSPSKQNGQR